ncbi:hypothetical protein Tco_0776725 [Tanacetum coccineum]
MSSYNHPSCSCCGGPFNGGNCPSCSSVGSGNEFVYDPNPYSYNETPNFFNQPPHYSPSQYETYSCEFCGNDAHYGYDCPPQVPFFPVIHHPPQATDTEMLQARENLIKSIQTFLNKFNRYHFGEIPKVLLVAWERFSEIKHAFTDKQYQPEDIQELMRKLLQDLQNISEELAEYINSPKDVESEDSFDYKLAKPTLLISPLSDANKDECFDPGGDEIDAFLDLDISTEIENDFHDQKGNSILS